MVGLNPLTSTHNEMRVHIPTMYVFIPLAPLVIFSAQLSRALPMAWSRVRRSCEGVSVWCYIVYYFCCYMSV